jgi:hypothetical protein
MDRGDDPQAGGPGTPGDAHWKPDLSYGGGAAPPSGPAGPTDPASPARPAPSTSPAAGAGQGSWFDDGADDDDDRTERTRRDPSAIRAEDTEPYIGLQYVARLFKVVAMVVIVALTAEIVAALVMEGPSALLPLFLELLQGAVLAAVLWGASDLTLLFIDVGHDVRAARVLLGRMSARMGSGYDAGGGGGGGGAAADARRLPRGGGEEYVG